MFYCNNFWSITIYLDSIWSYKSSIRAAQFEILLFLKSWILNLESRNHEKAGQTRFGKLVFPDRCVTTIFRSDGGPKISHLQWILNFTDSSIFKDYYCNMPKGSFKIIKCHHGCVLQPSRYSIPVRKLR